METIEILGYKRANLGKADTKKLRIQGNVPGVLYGGKTQMHFYIPMFFLRDLVYTPKAYFVKLNIEGMVVDAILQDIQFHPISEMMLHVDFLEIFDNKKIKMEIPIQCIGTPIGVTKGGVLAKKHRKLPIFAYTKDMPAVIPVPVEQLDLGQIVRVNQITTTNYTILALPNAPIASVDIPRALRSAASKA